MNFKQCEICFSNGAALYIDIFGEVNSNKNVSAIIEKHLWLEFKPSNDQQVICNECWNSLYEFNNFYETVKEIHSNKDSAAKRDIFGGDPFGDGPFADNDNGLDQKTQDTELLVEVKDEPPENQEKNSLHVLTTGEKDAGEAISKAITTRRSTRLKRKCASGPPDEKVDPVTDRLKRPNTRAIYNEDTSSEDDKLGFSASDESDDDENHIELNSTLKDLKTHSFSESENDTKAEDGDTKNSKGRRAKRKKDSKLFEHIDEFICYVCPERVEFERFYHATMHYKEHHKEPAYIKCKVCDKRCYTPGNFISHVAVHTDPDKYRCNICGKQNDQQVALAKHMRIHRREMEEKLFITCRLCPRRFATEKKRDRHEKHHNRKPMEKPPRIVGRDEDILEFYKRISCEICDQQRMVDVRVPDVEYENLQDLKKHMRDAHNDKGYLKCHICEKKCNIRSMLLIHKDFHVNPEKYRCDICGNVYQNLPKHKEGTHATPGEASFCCEHCGKALTSEKSLKSHMERKHAVKDVTCDICNKPFSKTTLESHKRVVHESASYMCTHCPRMFKSKFSLNRHQEEHEDKVRERVKCQICGVTFKHKYILTKHIDSVHTTEAPVACDVCGKKFKSKHHLWSHKSDTCNNRRFDCTICGRVFKVKVRLTEHMTTHTGKSLYQCTFCPMTFSFQSILYTHRKKAHYDQWLELQAKREEGIKFKVQEAPA
ncbi:AAEL000439-PA [Aedes aegypti]|uniref:AAEL000439-PA n=2 Tax=Aedes aegypti TaxID=7159 RepID=A0A1S4EVX1_AEDAE|nr:transcription factor grauzone [Aedes aegypti]EAT48499.1 AAEL000439-PA [Aedes aegypti]